MSASTTESVLVSEDWQLAPGDAKPVSLIVQLRQRVHILPWFRFIYAEGDNAHVEINFSSHLVTITGHGLAKLLTAVAALRVVRVIEPTDSEAKFGVRGPAAGKYAGPSIQSISVEPLQ